MIRVKLPDKKWNWNTKSWSRSNRSYISKCLEHSGSLPLKVELDFEFLMNRTDLFIELLKIGLQDTTLFTLLEADQREVVYLLCEFKDLSDLAYGVKIFTYWDEADIFNLVDEFIGSDAQFTR